MPGNEMSSIRVENFKRASALTTSDTSTVDGTYGAEEQAVLGNVRTRVNEIETILKNLGFLT